MSDLHFRELLRVYQVSGTTEDSTRMFTEGLRSGFGLADFFDHGLGWSEIRDNVWQLNPVFLTPDEVQEYKDYLYYNTDWNPSFIEHKNRLFARAQGDWHPTFPLRLVSVYLGPLLNSEIVRLAFWGADDTGREIDIGELKFQPLERQGMSVSGGYINRGIPAAGRARYEVLERIIRALPHRVSLTNILGLGFYPA